MSDNTSVILIPARLNSSRFPRKILAPIDGKPLIVRVFEEAKKSGCEDIYVACCSLEVKEIVESYGGKAIITDPDLPSGTDRVFAALSKLEKKPKFVVNLQGDTPIFDESIIPTILSVIQNNDLIEIATPVVRKICKLGSENQNVVKVVFNNMEKNEPGKALYFSRNHIPSGSDYFYSHMGIYAYRYEAIEKFVSLKTSFLEITERLEQLRALQNGMNIWAVPVHGDAIAVDTPEDLEFAIRFLENAV